MKTFAACLVAALGLTGCEGLSCTQVGCLDGVVLTLEDPAGLVPGVYDVTMEGSNGATFRCDLTVSDGIDGLLLQDAFCDDPQASISAGVDGNGAGLLSMTTPNLGDELTLIVAVDEVELISETSGLRYDRLEPNGPVCGPTCDFAEVRRSL